MLGPDKDDPELHCYLLDESLWVVRRLLGDVCQCVCVTLLGNLVFTTTTTVAMTTTAIKTTTIVHPGLQGTVVCSTTDSNHSD